MQPEQQNESGTSPIETVRSLKKRKLLLSDAIEEWRHVLDEAVNVIENLRYEKENAAHNLLAAIASLRAENATVRRRCESLESNEETTRDLANRRMEDAKSSEEKVSALDQELAETKIAFERLQREKLGNEETLVKKMRQNAEDAALIQNLRTQITELIEYKTSAALRIATQDNTTLQLVRDSESSAAESAGTAKRCKFLETERVRLSAELVEARSQLDISSAEHAAQLKSSAERQSCLRADTVAAKAQSETLAKQVTALHAKIKDFQDERERTRLGALNEAKKMEDILKIQKEATEDAEARAKKYHDLLAMVTESNKELAQKAHSPRKSLDAAAEALLKDMQKTLDQKLEDLAVQREELEKAQESERRIASEFQTLVREAEDSKRLRDQALARMSATEKENTELKKRVAVLEERILVGGSPQSSMRTPSRSAYDGNRILPRTGFLPSSARQEPQAMDLEMDAGTFTDAMDEMRQLREKHEAVIAALAARRGGGLTPTD